LSLAAVLARKAEAFIPGAVRAEAAGAVFTETNGWGLGGGGRSSWGKVLTDGFEGVNFMNLF